MTTLKVLERSRTSSITEVIEAIDQYGQDNVTLKFSGDVLYQSSKINFSDYESYIKLASVGNKETITSLFNELVSQQDYAVGIAKAAGVSIADFFERMLMIGVEKDVYFDNIPTFTPLHILNALAEKNLIRLYYIERTESIDLDFVRKYADQMDLGNLHHHTDNDEVRNFIDTYVNDDEQEED
jgi:hypothetical protein